MPLPLKKAVMTAQNRMSAAVIKNHTGSVENSFCLMPKDDNPSRIVRFANTMCIRLPIMIPNTMVGMFVMSVLLMSSPEV